MDPFLLQILFTHTLISLIFVGGVVGSFFEAFGRTPLGCGNIMEELEDIPRKSMPIPALFRPVTYYPLFCIGVVSITGVRKAQ